MIENLVSVTPDDFDRFFPKPSTAFGSAAFNMLNSGNAERVECLVGCDASGSPVMGLIAGLRDGAWRSPFSAPMAAISWRNDPSIATVESFLRKVTEYLAPIPLRIVLPPSFVAPSMLSQIAGTAMNMASHVTADFNFHYDLSLFPDFEKHLTPSARNKYHQSLKAGFIFDAADIARAYAVIRANRTAKGYYLAMTLEQVEATAEAIDIDAFVLSLDGTDVASAIVYRIAPGVAHVVYWGDTPGFERMRPMNILPYHIFSHYHSLGFNIVNIGTSSTDGVANHGLCSFKSSLGCTLSLIPSLLINNS
ncbi:MAG: GNAT family N-acetyltransferase [Muribaculaceae bacterium]|nr:GNAT family N-acetyltransferase [Muribaculaceae bacterium]